MRPASFWMGRCCCVGGDLFRWVSPKCLSDPIKSIFWADLQQGGNELMGGPVCRLLAGPAKGGIKTDPPGSQVVSIDMFEEKQKGSLLPTSPLSESSDPAH